MGAEEAVTNTSHDLIKVVRPDGSRPCSQEWLPRMQACVEAGDVRAALQLLQHLAPEYRPSAFLAGALSASPVRERGDGYPTLAAYGDDA